MIKEGLAYLEVSVPVEGGSSAPACPKDLENQGSLITLAWGKPSQDSGDRGAEGAEMTRDSLETLSQRFEDREDGEAPPAESDSAGGYEQRSTLPQVTSEK